MTTIEVGGIYLYRLSRYDRFQRIRVRRIMRDGQRAEVVGEMNGVWMKHGWRTPISKLLPLATDIVKAMNDAEFQGWLDSDQAIDEYALSH